jgi:hypothetical protein
MFDFFSSSLFLIKESSSTISIAVGILIFIFLSNNVSYGDFSAYDPRPLVITDKKGTIITAENKDKTVTRNSSFFQTNGR